MQIVTPLGHVIVCLCVQFRARRMNRSHNFFIFDFCLKFRRNIFIENVNFGLVFVCTIYYSVIDY